MSTRRQVVLRFDTDNADFDDDPQGTIAKMLRSLAHRVAITGERQFRVLDTAGNSIGEFIWVHADDDADDS